MFKENYSECGFIDFVELGLAQALLPTDKTNTSVNNSLFTSEPGAVE